MQSLWCIQLDATRKEIVDTIMKSTPTVDHSASAVKLVKLVIDAFEPIAMTAPRNYDNYRFLCSGFRLMGAELYFGPAALLLGRHPALPEGVSHWDDLALLNSPHRVCARVGKGPILHRACVLRHLLVLGRPGPTQLAAQQGTCKGGGEL